MPCRRSLPYISKIHVDGSTVHRNISRYRLNEEKWLDGERWRHLPAIRSANPMHLPWNQPLQPSHSIMKSLLSCSFNSSSRFWQIQYRCSLSVVAGDEDALLFVLSGGDCRRDIASRYPKESTRTKKVTRRTALAADRFVQSVVVFIHSLFNKPTSRRTSDSHSVHEIPLTKQGRMKTGPFIKGSHPARWVVWRTSWDGKKESL